MKEILRTSLMIAMCFSYGVHAQNTPPEDKPAIDDLINDDDLVRESYIGSSDMPDGTAFAHLLGVLTSVEEDVAISIVRTKMDVDKETAAQVLASLVAEKGRFDTNVASASYEVGCAHGAPRVSGDDTYTALGAMDDMRQVYAEEHLVRAKEQMDSKLSAKLSDWISKAKSTITYVEFDKKKLHERAGKSGYETLTTICNELVQEGVKSE